MKTQTLESFIKETGEEFVKGYSKKIIDFGRRVMNEGGIYGEKRDSIEDWCKGFLSTNLRQAGEVAVEEFVKVLKNTPYTTKTDNSTSGFIERVIEKANLLKEK